MNLTKKIILLICLFAVLFPQKSFGEEVNPESYRRDYYKMPPQNELQEKANMRFKLNWEIPALNPEQPVAVTDSDGNITIYSGGKPIYSRSEDGTLTYFANGKKMFSREIMDSGDLYLFRFYNYKSASEAVIVNEQGDFMGREISGLKDTVVARFDTRNEPTFKLGFYEGAYWENDLLSRTWRRLYQWLPEEERLDTQDGTLLATWQRKTERFGKKGIWKVEKGLYIDEAMHENGRGDELDKRGSDLYASQVIMDMFYTWYSTRPTEDYERYDFRGTLIGKRDRTIGPTSYDHYLEGENERLGYKKVGDFGWRTEGNRDYEYNRYYGRWQTEYNGSKLVNAKKAYKELDYYDERIYNLEGNVDEIVRKDKSSDEVLVKLEDSIYFWEIENMDAPQLKDRLGGDSVNAGMIYEWVEDMRGLDKHKSSLVATVQTIGGKKVTLYNQFNKPAYTLTLSDPSSNTVYLTSMPSAY